MPPSIALAWALGVVQELHCTMARNDAFMTFSFRSGSFSFSAGSFAVETGHLAEGNDRARSIVTNVTRYTNRFRC